MKDILEKVFYSLIIIVFAVILYFFCLMIGQRTSDTGVDQRYEFWDYAHKSK